MTREENTSGKVTRKMETQKMKRTGKMDKKNRGEEKQTWKILETILVT